MAAQHESTHYKVLGVETTANPKEIKAAYLAKARVDHPDKGGDEVKFKAVAEAYAVLSNPELRVAYDRGGAAQVAAVVASGGGGPPRARVIAVVVEVQVGLDIAVTGGTVPICIQRSNGADVPAETVTLAVVVPKGCVDNLKVCLEGVGHLDPRCDLRGDVVVTVRIPACHGAFRRAGADFETDVVIPLRQCFTGGVVTIEGVPGRGTVKLRLPVGDGAILTPGSSLQVADAGLPVMNTWPEERGVLVVHVHVEFPVKLDAHIAASIGTLLGGDPVSAIASASSLLLSPARVEEEVVQKYDAEAALARTQRLHAGVAKFREDQPGLLSSAAAASFPFGFPMFPSPMGGFQAHHEFSGSAVHCAQQ